MHPKEWMSVAQTGLYCKPADLYIDPLQPVKNALVTHGHADHARAGHNHVIATPATINIMQTRYGDDMAKILRPLQYNETLLMGCAADPVAVSLHPAGHILGSAQAKLTYRGATIVVSGDYKRTPDPTCIPFEPIPCDVFVTEATFGLPVFCHPPIEQEVEKLLTSLETFPEQCHLVGVYALGKCQRIILALRQLGYHKPIYLHGALINLCRLYQEYGFEFGELVPVNDVENRKNLKGEIVLAPPSALSDRWSRSLPNLRTAMASGWMQIRARSKQRRAELPLIISDHCDWYELLQTLSDVAPDEVWVTHGREEALVYQAQKMGFKAQALSLIGYEEGAETG